MIFRSRNTGSSGDISPLQRIHRRIADTAALRLSIIDATADGDVLVVFCSNTSMVKIIKLALQNHWPGETEVYCPASLMTGARDMGASEAKNQWKSNARLRRYN